MGTFGRELCPAGETDRRKRSARSDLGPDRRYLTGKNPPNNPITEAMMEQSTFAQQNAERMIESANFVLTWTRGFAEQTLNHSKAALDGFLKASNKIAKTFEGQSSAIREQTTVSPSAICRRATNLLHHVTVLRFACLISPPKPANKFYLRYWPLRAFLAGESHYFHPSCICSA